MPYAPPFRSLGVGGHFVLCMIYIKIRSGFFMKEHFDPKTQDIFLYLTKEEFGDFMEAGGSGIGGLKLVNDEKKVTFLLFRDISSPEQSSKVIDVQVAYEVPEKEGLYTNFVIYLGRRGCEQLAAQSLCEDRYTGLTGGEKVHILIEKEI